MTKKIKKESVFLLQHLHMINIDEEDVKIIGIYKTYERAIEAIERIKIQPGFSDHPKLIDASVDDDVDGFYIDEYFLDEDNWAEGFATVITGCNDEN